MLVILMILLYFNQSFNSYVKSLFFSGLAMEDCKQEPLSEGNSEECKTEEPPVKPQVRCTMN